MENPKVNAIVEIPEYSGNFLKLELDISTDLNGDASHESICEYIFSHIHISTDIESQE